MDWSETNSYVKGIINTLDELYDPIRVASFDLDDTLIHRPKKRSGNQKWQLIDSSISEKMADLVEKEFIIIIFTNQGGMGMNKNFDKLNWRKAVNELVINFTSKIKDNKFYFAIYAAKNYDMYRKPNIGMWEQMKKDLKDEFGLEKIRISKNSFFCGDAAGRSTPGYLKKKLYPSSKNGDFSDTDYKFALNIGIKFITPETFFGRSSPKLPNKLSGIDPREIIKSVSDFEYNFVPRKKEMIIMVGPPGSGKTEFVKKYILPHEYVHINQDTCRTQTKCLRETIKSLEEKKSIVIDNTNPDVPSRMKYTTLAMEYGYKHIRAIIINTDLALAKHLNNTRHIYSEGIIPKISEIVYAIYRKNFSKPQKSENFDKIETIDFIFDIDKLDDPLWKKIFMRWSE